MKPKLIYVLLNLAILIIFVFYSCSSDKLNRNNAEVLIQDYFEYPVIEIANFNLENIFGNPLEQLINKGFIYINKRSYLWSNAATLEGERYQSKSNKNLFATCTKSFNEITGIVFLDEKETKATIEYSCKRSDITPFGEFLGFYEGQVITCSAEAMKYDDGWRITSAKGNVFKPSDFSYSKENNQENENPGDEIVGDTDAPVILPADSAISTNSNISGRFPIASKKLLTLADLNGLSKNDLKIMRNEIFARHGYIFRTSDMKSYFSQQIWYHGKYDDVTSMLTNIEKQNITFVKLYE